MTTRILICDDSNLARRQMARALPADWDVDVTLACDGKEALEALRAGQGEILFLDLNMPNMDGYEVLAAIRSQDLPTMPIVVSGDIQPEAERRVKDLGALAFIKKPFKPEQIQQILKDYGLWDEVATPPREEPEFSISYLDTCQELANIAMGQAADRLARWLDVFIHQPIPKVREIRPSELGTKLRQIISDQSSVLRQGFVGGGMAGEALFVCADEQLPTLASLADYPSAASREEHDELVMDLGSIIIGAFLTGLGEQLDTTFSQRHPQILHRTPEPQLKDGGSMALCIEIPYEIEQPALHYELLLLFSPGSLDTLKQRLSYFTS